MAVTVHAMSVGEGTDYLTRSVANADRDTPSPEGEGPGMDPVIAYYTETGTPPGYWLGRGIDDLGGGGALVAGDRVTTTQLQRLLDAGRDPVTTEPLGRAYPKIVPLGERIEKRTATLDPGLSPTERQAAVDQITQDEQWAGKRHAVGGFDLTFSPMKSVSVLWGLSDRTTQALILGAHRAAVTETLRFIEDHVAATRTGTDAGDGSIAQVDVTGLIATAFDHWDSRAHDPQLHTHLVIANKVRAVTDGKWRTLDSRALFNANVAFSEHYDAVLADRLTASLGVQWERRPARGKNRNPGFEIVGVSDELIEEFSTRSADIEPATDKLIAEYREKHGRMPSRGTINRLREQANLATRPPKSIESLADLSAQWRDRAARILGQDPGQWARDLIARSVDEPGRSFTAHDVPNEVIEKAAAVVLRVVGDKRATWKHWHLWAEAERQTKHWRLTTHHDRVETVARIVATAEGASVLLTPPELAPTPDFLLRADGTTTLRPKHSQVFTSQAVLNAETRLLAAMIERTAPHVDTNEFRAVLAEGVRQGVLDASQAEAVIAVAGSGRRLDLLVGPAGTGKTTTLRALRAMWEQQHGPGTVVGLAPSAAAADVLGTELGIECENTAMWLTRHRHGRAEFEAGQLVIVDEASLAGTHTLDRITRLAAEAGAKVLLVGDPAQLPAVETGGALNLLVSERARTTEDVPTLTDVHRFHADWEKHATLRLRDGDPDVLNLYTDHGRIQAGTTDDMTDAAYTAWKADTRAGRSSVLVVPDNATMNDLNRRARAERVLAGHVSDGRHVHLAGQTRASAGDLVITRDNDRHLRYGREGWVRNGDRWRILHVHRDGSVTVQRVDLEPHTNPRPDRDGAPSWGIVRLPAAYVTEHVDLGYAITAHRAQGLTVDTAHTVASPTMSRENLYVALTRGRTTNTVFVPVDQPDRDHNHEHAIGAAIDPDMPELTAARAMLAGILHRVGAEPSAHQSRQDEEHRWGSIAQLAAEYDTIASHAQRPHWTQLVAHTLAGEGFTRRDIAQVVESDAFGPLCAELRRAEADGHDVTRLLPRLAAARSLHDADDIAAVLHHRLTHTATRTSTVRNRIAGLIPQAQGQFPDDVREALDRRAELIEDRARTLAGQALRDRQPWTRHLPPRPHGPAERAWQNTVAALAAYRDRYAITTDDPFGEPPTTLTQRDDARRIRNMVQDVASTDHAPNRRTILERSTGPDLG
ncbi:conjugative relaxase-like TrwC/TraI family protein [Promicromonospora sp. AC04]|uniref:MobF family relaxase n=1 Tax=Promicromonospora sp. AC04 TaxID=2135723 RepID=UPI000D3421A0|nr:MobF family relaxase [Promicromonospora sp. AC04]PUB26802.1 conjugative relaxase-like TrwC/TraI family protein [Promicromonospora sp. AC04]